MGCFDPGRPMEAIQWQFSEQYASQFGPCSSWLGNSTCKDPLSSESCEHEGMPMLSLCGHVCGSNLRTYPSHSTDDQCEDSR